MKNVIQNQKKYNPFNIKDYYIVEQNDKKYFKYNDVLLELNANGYVPKSGLLFDMILNPENCKGKEVIDLGCGYLGMLGFLAHYNGAKIVDSIDFDSKCVEWFNKLIKDNNFSNINCFVSNYFQNIANKKYDIILANPPQMPMLDGNIHDSGDLDGRKYILKIMKESLKHLKENGVLYLLAFDFLGIDERTNDNKSIIEIANDLGYIDSQVVLSVDKPLKQGSVTYDSIDYINKVYPLYNFGNDDKKCKIKIVRMKNR